MLAVRILRDGLPVVIAVVAAEAEQHRRIAIAGAELPVKLLQSRVDGRAHFCVVFHGDALRTQRVEIMLLTQVIALAVIGDALDDGVAEDLQIFMGIPPACLYLQCSRMAGKSLPIPAPKRSPGSFPAVYKTKSGTLLPVECRFLREKFAVHSQKQ